MCKACLLKNGWILHSIYEHHHKWINWGFFVIKPLVNWWQGALDYLLELDDSIDINIENVTSHISDLLFTNKINLILKSLNNFYNFCNFKGKIISIIIILLCCDREQETLDLWILRKVISLSFVVYFLLMYPVIFAKGVYCLC